LCGIFAFQDNDVISAELILLTKIYDSFNVTLDVQHTITDTHLLKHMYIAGTADTGDMVGSGIVGFGMTGSGTVGSGADYISVMATLATFSTMQPKQCFNVTIIDDMEVEISEDFFATLTLIPSSLTIVDLNRTTIDPLKATVSIMDNDVRKL